MADEKQFDWSKFDKEIDMDGLQNDIEEAENASDYPDIPDGEYDVTVVNMELGKSKVKDNGKGGDPMLKVQFQIMGGEFKDNRIFYNGVIQMGQKDSVRAFQIHNVNTMLRAIADDQKLKWGSFGELADLIDDVFDDVGTFVEGGEVDEGQHYNLKQSTNKRNADFKDLEILEVLK